MVDTTANRIHQNVSLARGRKLYDNARRRCDDARGLVGGAELCIRMHSKAGKIMYYIQLRRTSMVVAYFNILQNER